MHRRQRSWSALAAALAAVVTGAMVVPASSPGPAPSGSLRLGVAGIAVGVDTALHVAGFFAILVTAGLGVADRPDVEARRTLFLVGALAVVLGAGAELVQSVVPGRTPDVFDLLADVIGVAMGIATHLVRRWRRS